MQPFFLQCFNHLVTSFLNFVYPLHCISSVKQFCQKQSSIMNISQHLEKVIKWMKLWWNYDLMICSVICNQLDWPKSDASFILPYANEKLHYHIRKI
jgi:hypothetical protein